jgi:hypothetical protein
MPSKITVQINFHKTTIAESQVWSNYIAPLLSVMGRTVTFRGSKKLNCPTAVIESQNIWSNLFFTGLGN